MGALLHRFIINFRKKIMPLIKQIDNKTFDVFTGNGFHNWTRVKRFHWGIKPVEGKHLTRQQISELNSILVT